MKQDRQKNDKQTPSPLEHRRREAGTPDSSSKRSPVRTRWAGAICLTLLGLSSGTGCARRAQASAEFSEPASFPIVSVTKADAAYEREHVAEIRAVRRVELRSRIKGFLESVAVDEGKAVTAGQSLFTINALDLKQQMRIAQAATGSTEAELKSAELERDGTRLLFEKNVVSAAELALAESKLESLRAKRDEARANEGQVAIQLGYAQIRAPFAGVINRIPLRAGAAVEESEPLTTLTDTSEVYAYFRMSEAEYLEYSGRSGDIDRQVWLRLADGSTHPSPGVVDAVESEFDRETGNIAFRARFPNQEGRLKHGSGGKVVLKTDLRDAITVPQKSTFEIQEQLYVYVVDAENTARARRIMPKLRLKDSFVVDSGLAAGERIVAEGVQKLRDGNRLGPAAPAAGGNG